MLYWSLQVYGQCKAAIYISKVHRVVRLYKYDCVVRPGKKNLKSYLKKTSSPTLTPNKLLDFSCFQ